MSITTVKPIGDWASFPNPTEPKEVKLSKEYGLAWANAIWSEHNRGQNISLYNTRRANDIINRKYREGLQSIQNLKNRLDIDGDTSYLNLDFTPINKVAALVDNIKGKLINMPVNIQCNPIDSESKSRFDDYKKEMYANMYIKQNASDLEQKSGIPLVPKGKYVPENKDEADLHLSSFKLDEAIAMEQALLWINKENGFDESRAKVIEDLITLKRGAFYTYYDENYNIRHEYIDVVDVMTPYSKYDDFRNVQYISVMKQYQLWEIAQMNPELTDEDLYTIARQYQGKNMNPTFNFGQSYEGYYNSNTGARPYINFNITIVEFYFITPVKEVRVKKKNSKGAVYSFKKKSENYEGENTDNKETISKECGYTFKGKWIPDSQFLWDYGMIENQLRYKLPDGSYSLNAILPITMIAPGIYDMVNKSIVERLRSFEDLWNLAHQKMQQELIKSLPPGFTIDMRGLDGAIFGNGAPADPIEVTKMILQTGSLAYSSVDKDGKPIQTEVFKRHSSDISGNIEAYIRVQNHYLELMNQAIGFNSAVDASSPNSNDAVGARAQAAQATLDALRPLYNSYANLVLRSTKKVAIMIQDCIERNYESFVSAIGSESAEIIKKARYFPLCTFGLELEVLPDLEEKSQLEGYIVQGLQSGQLFPSDAIRIRQEAKMDLKRATKLLAMLENKNRADAQTAKDKDIQNNGAVQQQSAQAAAAAQADLHKVQTQNEIAKLQQEYAIKDAFEQKQFKRQVEIQKLKNIGLYTVAEINTHGKIGVQHAANEGKIVAQQVASQYSIEKEHVIHDHKLRHTAFEAAITPVESTESEK